MWLTGVGPGWTVASGPLHVETSTSSSAKGPILTCLESLKQTLQPDAGSHAHRVKGSRLYIDGVPPQKGHVMSQVMSFQVPVCSCLFRCLFVSAFLMLTRLKMLSGFDAVPSATVSTGQVRSSAF